MARRTLPTLDGDTGPAPAPVPSYDEAVAMASRGEDLPSADTSIVGLRAREMRTTQHAKAFHRARRAGEVDETPTKVVVITDRKPWAIVELSEDECYVDDDGVPHRFKRVGEVGSRWVGEGDHREKEPVLGPVDNERPLSHGRSYVVPRWNADLLVAKGHATIVS